MTAGRLASEERGFLERNCYRAAHRLRDLFEQPFRSSATRHQADARMTRRITEAFTWT